MTKYQSILSLISDPSWQTATVIARVTSFRRMGNIAFSTVQSAEAKIQIVLKKDVTPNFKETCAAIQLGVHISVSGSRYVTSTNELSILADRVEIVQTANVGFPDKFHGLKSDETVQRKRYISTSTDLEAAAVFITRSKIIYNIRKFLIERHDYLEVETPTLMNAASGALAKPFITHSNSMDRDYFLRIAPEIHLKMMIAGGYPKIFEIGKNYRNEGISKQHLNEFSMIEWYEVGATYEDNKALFLKLIKYLLDTLGFYNQITPYDCGALDWNNIPTVLYRDLFAKHNLPLPDSLEPSVADELFKKTIRPTIWNPLIVQDYPARMSPLAARKTDDDSTACQWQLIVAGQEIVKCYNEETSPTIQRKSFEEQAAQRESGDEEAMMIDEEFLECLGFGVPSILSGLGIGIDRLVAILTDKRNIRDVVFSPLMG